MYFYIIFILWICAINCQKDFFVAKTYVKNNTKCNIFGTGCYETTNNYYYCITKSPFAISWIFEDTKSLQEASKFIPRLTENNPFQNIEIPKYWTLESSLDGYINELILDWRWENIKQYRTTFIENSFKELDFVPVLSNLENNFTIPLSILTEEAHIFLCDGSDVSKSSCYWILMQSYGGTKTAFRKCDANYIETRNTAPEEPCKTFLKTINHPQDFPLYMSKDKWSHFKIEKRNNRITLFQVNEGIPREIITYVDDYTVFDVKHMVIHSKRGNGLWKIHNRTYMFTRQQTSRIRFGPDINTVENSVCISMYTSMCSTCSIILSLAKADNPSLILHEEKFGPKRGWTEIKLIKNNISEEKVVLLVSTTDSSNHESFWAIDGMRQCQKRESRYISTDKPAKCQLISNSENIISTHETTYVYNENNCPENTLSSYCVPCKWFLEDCGRTKVYEKYKSTTKYSCSTGHRGAECDISCNDGTYGQGCTKKCGKCKNKVCNKFDGTCESCEEDYSGQKCDIPPKKVRNLQITVLNSSSVLVGWDKPLFYFDDNNKNNNNLSYVVKYQHKSYMACNQNQSNMKWESVKTVYVEHVTITDLAPYSSYTILIFPKYGNDEGQPEHREFQTHFLETLQEHEIPKVENINPKSRYVVITFSKLDCTKIHGPILIKLKASCSDEWCRDTSISQSDLDYNKGVSKALTDLMPFSKYVLEIKYCRNDLMCSDIVKSQHFETESTAPGVVNDPEVYSKNEYSASLRWKPPYPPKGILETYIVSYHYGNIKNSKNFTTTQCSLWPDFHCVTLTGLTESKNYTIQIMAKNKDVSNLGGTKAIYVYTETEPSDAPYDIKIHWTLENHLELEWKHPNHTNGDIIKFNITAIPQLKSNTKYNIYKELLVKEYRLIYHYKINATNILPSTNYKILISAFNGYEGKQQVMKGRSPPSIPSLDNPPKIISVTNTTITLEILTNQIRSQKTSNEYKLFILGYDSNTNIQSHPELERFKKDFQISLPQFKMIYECQVLELNNSHFTIGNNEDIKECTRKSNYSINPKAELNIAVLLTNNDGNKSRYRIYYISDSDATTFLEPRDLSLLGLLALLLIIPIIIIIYMKRKPIVEQYNTYKNSFHRNNGPSLIEAPEETPLTKLNKPSDGKETKIYSKPIKVDEFENYVKNTISNGELERQHALFPRGQTKPWECGAKTTNKSKNRYANLIAYDHTRVVLQKIDGKEDSDYINANYIDGYQIPRAYIATQGPKMSTTHDFWRMIWENNVQHIAMLANVIEGGKKKVEQYWPGINDTCTFHDITIQFVSNQVFSDYEYRVFTVTKNNQDRKVHQYHFMSWPDHGVPLYSQSLVPFLQRLLQIPLSSNSPIVVHCSAGVGRTGTILLCDMSLRMAGQKGIIDILRNLQKLRDQRPNMVDNIHQYKLAHLVILECLSGMKTGIPCNDIEKEVERLLNNDKINLQMRYLEDTAWQDQIMKDVSPSKVLDIVKEKNRFHDIIPEPQGCIYLPRYPSNDDKSIYINAVTVDGFQSSGRFIVTQQPMPNTLGDFWRLVAEKNSSVIISLNDIDLKNKTSCNFWPTEKNRQMIPVDYITLKHASTLNLECYDLTTVHMHLNGEQEYAIVEIISMKNWPSNTNCPKKIEDFLTFWEDANTTSRKSNPVIVTCFDGAKASGLYVAMTFIIEKMKLEQICDVCQAVRNVRHNRSQFVRNEEQFAFLYKAAVSYINGFESYANFN